jgi:hypothetical protein
MSLFDGDWSTAMQVAVAGFGGGLAYLMVRKPANTWIALGTLAVGTICAAYLTPIASALMVKWLGIVLTEQAKLACAFLMGIGGMSLVNIVTLVGEWFQRNIGKILSLKFKTDSEQDQTTDQKPPEEK